MPALPSSILAPLREQFLALVDLAAPAGIDTHPLGGGTSRVRGNIDRASTTPWSSTT